MAEGSGDPDHVEWVGVLWCRIEQDGFEWETGEVECPHCGTEFYNPAPENND